MSESADSPEIDFVRLWLPTFRSWVQHYEDCGAGFHATLTGDEKAARVYINPPPTMLQTLTNRLGVVEQHPASYAEWIEQRDDTAASVIRKTTP